MTTSKLTTVAFKCNEEESERLKEMAAKADCSVSKFVHDLVTEAISDGHVEGPVPRLALTEATQIRMAEGVFLLCALARNTHMANGVDDPLFESAAERAVEILEGTQS